MKRLGRQGVSAPTANDTFEASPRHPCSNLIQTQGYDHSYFFVSTFIEDHLRWHAQRLASLAAP
jgi:S-formylglutathione hydrolase FrmB